MLETSVGVGIGVGQEVNPFFSQPLQRTSEMGIHYVGSRQKPMVKHR